ncbi:hypothetical protein KSS87_017198 [Heliosperma pusillum]|nr:hypothetical protein KSS87_017198 [Heliosperma pusillum]
MPQVRIIAKNFMDMVASLPAVKLDTLYANPFICEAILSGSLPRKPMPLNTVPLPSVEELEKYALEQWECFLLHLISSSQAEKLTNFSPSMIKVFQRGLLSQREKEGSRLTEYGFQFLLMDTNAQLWYIIREYIANAEERGVEAADLISFLLELSFHEMGQAYNINTLTEVQSSTIKDLADLGLVRLHKGMKESWFIPTKLATTLSVSLSDTSTRKQGYVVVETNFRMYAYSSSKLHCEILRLFASDLVVLALLECMKALGGWLEIITFLQQNAHPRAAERVPTVPENVTDQIRLWESDLNRVEMLPAQLYDEFPSQELFDAACDFARQYGGLLWEDTKRKRLIVKTELHTEMRDYLRRQR